MIKWFAILGIVGLLGSGGYWVTTEIMEKGRLESELSSANSTIELLGVAMAEKDKREVELYNKRLELEDEAVEKKEKFNLSEIQKVAKADPIRAAKLFAANTDILLTDFEQRVKSFQRRDKDSPKMPDKR